MLNIFFGLGGLQDHGKPEIPKRKFYTTYSIICTYFIVRAIIAELK